LGLLATSAGEEVGEAGEFSARMAFFQPFSLKDGGGIRTGRAHVFSQEAEEEGEHSIVVTRRTSAR
jgi:hypothetical protein